MLLGRVPPVRKEIGFLQCTVSNGRKVYYRAECSLANDMPSFTLVISVHVAGLDRHKIIA